MFETYREAWRALRRWWRVTPLALKVVTPLLLLVAMLLPIGVFQLLDGIEGGRKRNGRRAYPPPTDFKSDESSI